MTFKDYLQQQGLASRTIEKYSVQLGKFLDYTNKETIQLQNKDVLDYLHYLEQQGRNVRTRSQVLSIIKHYSRYVYEHSELPQLLAANLKLRGTHKLILYKTLTIEQLNEFVDHYQNTYPDELRNTLLLSCIVYQGLRPNEFRQLQVTDVNLQKMTMHIAATRKTNARTLKLEALQVGLLYRYMHEVQPQELLFTSLPCLQKWQKKLIKTYPLMHSFKQLRASIITYWIQTVGLRQAQYRAGHRYVSATEAYLQNDLQGLSEDIANFHPLG